VFWELSYEFSLTRNEWLNTGILSMNYNILEKKIDNYYNKTSILQKYFSELPDGKNILKAIVSFRKELDQLKEKVWLIELLTTEAMVKRI